MKCQPSDAVIDGQYSVYMHLKHASVCYNFTVPTTLRRRTPPWQECLLQSFRRRTTNVAVCRHNI